MKEAILTVALLVSLVSSLRGDEVRLTNGDHWTGKIIAFTNDLLVVQTEAAGRISLARNKVESVAFGDAHSLKAAQPAPGVSIEQTRRKADQPTMQGADGDLTAAVANLARQTNLLSGFSLKALDEAGPEARAKFNEMMSGLLTGKISVTDIRAQAKSTADQLRALKRELGEESGGALDVYLSVLDRFVGDNGAKPAAPPSK